MTTRYFLIAGLLALPLLYSQAAQAAHGDYCREYTKSVRIGGRIEAAYGTACFQPDGSWQIVSLNGHRPLYDDIRRDARHDAQNVIIIRDTRPVYYRSHSPGWRIGYYPWRNDWHHYGHHKKKHYKHHSGRHHKGGKGRHDHHGHR